MATENINRDVSNPSPGSNEPGDKEKDIKNREEYQELPETGWEAGQNIKNAEFIPSGDEDHVPEQGPADAGIGMEEIRKKQKGANQGRGSGVEGTGGSQAGT